MHVSAVDSVRDLGVVVVDSSGTMKAHINSVCKAASHSLWRIGKLRNLLDQSSTEKLIHGVVTSKLGYCNSLYFGLYDYQIKKLHNLQNAAARLVTRRRLERHTDMTPILREPHWLAVELRIEFKTLCITFKIIRHPESAPQYLADLVTVHVPRVRTESCDGLKLTVSKFRPRMKT